MRLFSSVDIIYYVCSKTRNYVDDNYLLVRYVDAKYGYLVSSSASPKRSVKGGEALKRGGGGPTRGN